MKTIQKVGYATLASALLANQSFAQGNGSTFFGGDKLNGSKVVGTQSDLKTAGENIINNAMLFLAILAVCYGLYGGFLMMTAGGDDGKVTKGKTILIQVGLGLIVIFLAGSIVKWVLGLLQGV